MLWICAAIAIISVMCVFSLSVSRLDITFSQAIDAIWNHITGDLPTKSEDYSAWWRDKVIVDDNAPRTMCGVCVGAILAICGAMMQSITRNPLTDPYTLGISSAALLGMAIGLVFDITILPIGSQNESYIGNAFLFSLIPVAVVLTASSVKKAGPTMMVLVGIAMMYVFSSFTTFIKYNADAEQIHEMYEWSLGSLSSVGWNAVYILIATFVLLAIGSMVMAEKMNVVLAGDKEAMSLGEDPGRIRRMCFLMIALSTSVTVCFTGSIGFVGLVAPHIARLFVGSNCKTLIPASALIGSIMVVGADILVRSLPNVLPVGVITALIGSPVFLYFLYIQRRKAVWS